MESRFDLHESLSREPEVRGPSERAFGLTFAAVFFLFTAFLVWRDSIVWPVTLGLGLAFLAFAVLVPRWLRRLNSIWLRFGLALHAVFAPVVMGFLFFMVITPAGVMTRAVRRDFLRLKFDTKVSTYWIDRRPPGPNPETMRNQF